MYYSYTNSEKSRTFFESEFLITFPTTFNINQTRMAFGGQRLFQGGLFDFPPKKSLMGHFQPRTRYTYEN